LDYLFNLTYYWEDNTGMQRTEYTCEDVNRTEQVEDGVPE